MNVLVGHLIGIWNSYAFETTETSLNSLLNILGQAFDILIEIQK